MVCVRANNFEQKINIYTTLFECRIEYIQTDKLIRRLLFFVPLQMLILIQIFCYFNK